WTSYRPDPARKANSNRTVLRAAACECDLRLWGRHDLRRFLRWHRSPQEDLATKRHKKHKKELLCVLWPNLLPQAPTGRCSDYRATQKGRGWLERLFQN